MTPGFRRRGPSAIGIFGFWFTAICLAQSGAAFQPATQDTIRIASVTPNDPVRAGVKVRFTFELEVTLRSAEAGVVSIGFNDSEATASQMMGQRQVRAGTHRVRISVDTVPVDRGRMMAFGALIIIGPARTSGGAMRFQPIASLFHPIEVIGAELAEPPRGITDFEASSTSQQRVILEQIANGRSPLAVDDVVEIIRSALRHRDGEMRLLAMKAVGGRALTSILARYRGPARPDRRDPLTARAQVPPADWITDDERLGYSLRDTLLETVRSDRDERVRTEALKAMSVIGRLDSGAPYSDEFVQLCEEVFRNDRSGLVRAQVVDFFDRGPNDSPLIRAVLRDAHADVDEQVRVEAIRSLTAPTTEGPRLSFDEVGAVLVRLLGHPVVEFRETALRALEVLGAAARPALVHIDRLASHDPDPGIRQFATRVSVAIRNAP